MAARKRPAPAGGSGEPATRILSSAHLAEGQWGASSEFEFGLIVAYNAFSRWAVRCMAAAGMPDLTITDVLVLHHVHHRGRSKKLADICFTLSYEDTHVVNYSLKKLLGLGLLSSEKIGKEVFYGTTHTAEALVRRYRAVRDQCLLPGLPAALDHPESLSRAAAQLRALSGIYDQAARAATSL